MVNGGGGGVYYLSRTELGKRINKEKFVFVFGNQEC